MEAARRIAAALNAEKVILFGSYAWGVPRPDSDLDLLAVVPDAQEPLYRLARKAYRALRGLGVPVDVVIRTRSQVERYLGLQASLEHVAWTRGIVLHG